MYLQFDYVGIYLLCLGILIKLESIKKTYFAIIILLSKNEMEKIDIFINNYVD